MPSVSATPLELSNEDVEVYVRERHASLQNADFSLDQVVGLIARQSFDQSRVFAPGKGIALEIEDAYLTGEPVEVRASPESEWESLEATLQDVATSAVKARVPLTGQDGAWRTAELPALAEGEYRVTVSGRDSSPVTDVFAVIDDGADLSD